MRRTVAILLLLSVPLWTGCSKRAATAEEALVVFHHGSPTPAIEAAERAFLERHPGARIRRERGDALPNMRKVTDMGRRADIVYTDDYSIIPPVMFPKHADFWIRYAHDEMTIAYAARSKHASEITAGNWFEVLQRPGVKWGIADPNAGPDGYFSLGQILLSDLHYGRDVFRDLVEANTAVTARRTGDRFVIDCPANLRPNGARVVVRADPESLYPMLLAGEIDYAFTYMGSVVGEGPSGIRTIDLPPQVDLSDLSLAGSLYGRVTINLFADQPDRRLTVTLGAKANGLTIPLDAPHRDAAAEYLALFLGPVGQDALRAVHITPLVPAETNDLSKAPPALRPLLRQAR
jgi:molybdate/tungstate transport system substrate-binding protein